VGVRRLRDVSRPISLDEAAKRAASLPCWSRRVDPQPLKGGITNRNFIVEDRGRRFVVRIGGDIPEHMVVRANDVAAARAAHAAGISPEVIHAESDAVVLGFIEGRTLTAEDVHDEAMLARVLSLMIACHREVPKYLRGPVLAFWVFHVIRDYFARLRDAGGRRSSELPGLVAIAERLEAQLGRIELVFGHNDWLAANIIDDGRKLWLIDWDYAGFNSPLFDIGNLSGNNALSAAQEEWLLQHYFEREVDDDLRRRYAAMKCAALLREAMWSLVAELYSTIDHDFAGYTDTSLAGFARAVQEFEKDWGSL
jgi:thiamine kinase-like enzyme